MSRERIGSEVDLMIRSARPTQAMTLIGELGLAATVFPAPDDLVVEEGGAVLGESDGVAALPATWCVACGRGGWCPIIDYVCGICAAVPLGN